ncbi:MAG: MinD/ParA family protein, partial [Spirochaetia bacterium]|nr:MinD/ParA family protein [Spirochaetia bacterium]
MIDQAEGLRKMVAELRGAENERLRESRRGRQKVIAVASGKGGVGKTGFSVNLAIAMAREDQRVLILDADLGLSNANIVMGEMPKWNLYHVLKGEKKLSEVVSKTRHGVDLIAGGSGIHELANLTGTERQRFIGEMDGLENYDVIVIDTGAGISHNVTSFLHAADKVVIITTPEPTAVTDAYGIIKALVVGGMDLDIDLVVNRARSVEEGRKIAEHILGIAHQFLNASIHALGSIPDDPAVVRAVYKKTPYLIFEPKAPASRAVNEIASKLLSLPFREERDVNG